MKVTSITSILYEYPLRRPIGDVHLPMGVDHGLDLAVFIHTDAELTGVSVATAGARYNLPQLATLVVGSDPRSIQSCWDRMIATTFKSGNKGPINESISAIDCALWDLRAKINGVPLWKELGADNKRVSVYASALDFPLSDGDLYKFYAEMAGRGVTTGKLKVGRNSEDDQRRLKLMLKALSSNGARPRAIIDANEFWSPKQAVQRISELERECDFVWVEEPVRRWDYDGLRRVSEGIRAPVATGENFNAVEEFAPLFLNGSVDVVQISSHISGITGARAVAALASAFDRPVTMNNDPGRAMAHLAASLTHHTMMEVLDVGRDAALCHPLQVNDGCIVLGEEPGSGIEFDMDFLKAHEHKSVSGNTLSNSYVRAEDAGLVG